MLKHRFKYILKAIVEMAIVAVILFLYTLAKFEFFGIPLDLDTFRYMFIVTCMVMILAKLSINEKKISEQSTEHWMKIMDGFRNDRTNIDMDKPDE